jgi:hypothetical protein
MDGKAAGRSAWSVLALLVGVVIGVGSVAVAGASSNGVTGSYTTQQADVANDKRIAPFKAKAGKKAYEQFPTINGQFIAIQTDDNIAVEFHGPTLGTWFHIGEKRPPQQAISLPLAVPIDSWRVSCQNRVYSCDGIISIVGGPVSAG